VGQAADIVSNNAKISYTDAAAVALNTAKVSYDDAAAVAANTAKVGITTAQASAITANTAKVTYDDAAAVALNTAKISYTDAAAVALNTAKVSVPAGGTTSQVLSKVSGTDYDLQWSAAGAGVNLVYGNAPDGSLNVTGAMSSVTKLDIVADVTTVGADVDGTWTLPIINNASNFAVTGTGTFGNIVPTLLQEDSVYDLDKPGFFGIGDLIKSNMIINLNGVPQNSTAGGYAALSDFTQIDNTHTSAVTLGASYTVNAAQKVGIAGNALTVTDMMGYRTAVTVGANATVTRACGLCVYEPTVQTGGTLATSMGINIPEKNAGTANIGYSYGVPETSGSWAFNSGGSTHPVKFGGGVVKQFRDVSIGAVTMLSTDYHVFSSSTGAVSLPAIATCEIGQIFVYTNSSGSSKTVGLNGAATSYGKSVTVANEESRQFVKRSANSWVVY